MTAADCGGMMYTVVQRGRMLSVEHQRKYKKQRLRHRLRA